MNQYQYDHINQDNENESFGEIKQILKKILSKWYFVLISVAIAFMIAYVNTKYSDRIYKVEASILVKDPKNLNNSIPDLIYGEELLDKSSNNLENVAFLLKRYDIVKQTLEDIGAEAYYYYKNKFRTIQLYDDSPIKVESISDNIENMPIGINFLCEIVNYKYFSLRIEDDEELNITLKDTVFRFNQTINLNDFAFNVKLIESNFDPEQKKVYFHFNNIDRLADRYASSIEVSPIEKSSIIKLSLEGSNAVKERDFLNKLMDNYLYSGLREKTMNAAKTIEFIDYQLTGISDSLSQIEAKLENFKTHNTIDLGNEAGKLYDEVKALEKEKSALMVKNKYLNYLQEFLKNQNINLEEIVVPSSMGVDDPVINSLVEKLIDLKLEQKRIPNQNNMDNPPARRLRDQIESLKNNIIRNIRSIQSANNIALQEINQNINAMSTDLRQLPEAERQFVNIDRMHNLSENLYLFLQQKKAEAGLAKATTTSDIKIVNQARISNNGNPIKPKPLINYATAILLGLLIPTAFFYVSDQFNDKIRTEEDIAKLTSIPLLGTIGYEKSGNPLILQDPYSPLAESFRTIRTNLRYMKDEKKKSCETYMVTSSISGEGKTFCAKNLAYIFAISGKKTLYINTDMRKQNRYDEFALKDDLGLSSYMANMDEHRIIIHPTNTENLFILPSGKTPPNPSELLLKERFSKLMKVLKTEFDYIILDTPPVGILSDAMEVSKHSDLDIIIVRQNYTRKKNLSYGNHIYKERKMNKMAIVFNGVKNSKLYDQYNYYYDYAYGQSEEESSSNFKNNVSGLFKSLSAKKRKKVRKPKKSKANEGNEKNLEDLKKIMGKLYDL